MRVLPRCLTVLGLPKTAVSSRRGKLDGRVATSCGPKLFREVASLLSLSAERKVKVVGEGQSYLQKAHISLKSETVWD